MKATLFFISFTLSLTFAQQGAIKFQIPVDSTGKPVAPVPAPAVAPAPAAVPAPVPVLAQEPQKPAVASNSLNLAELSAKDTASFETYSKRRSLVQDSIAAMKNEIENLKKRAASTMPVLEPKGEFEKQSEFDARKAKWEKDLDENTRRDSKALMDRIAELEKASKKIEENQASLYSSIEIKTNPEAASILLNREEIGASPIKYNLALPGQQAIRIQKENYEPWDTVFTLQPAQKIKISVDLQEKSIFSKEGELDFSKILAKDTTVEGYRQRILRVEARSNQVDGEISVILEDFTNKYPALEPQKPDETVQDFENRKTAWTNEGLRQYAVLMKKHEAYKNKLVRTKEVLEDNIMATESQIIVETPLSSKITLGAYDVEKEVFEVVVEDTANVKAPFHFVGVVEIPRDTAKVMNRSTDGFLTSISYINYPFVSGDSSFYLAMKELSLSRKAVPLKVAGEFKSIGRFEAMAGYGAWRAHADSLLKGELKAKGLDLNYALNDGSIKPAKEPGEGLGWRTWTRIVAFTGVAVFGTLAVVKNSDAEDAKKKIKEKKKTWNGDPDVYETWYNENISYFKSQANKLEDSESSRNIFGICAGVSAIAATVTFIF